MGLGLLLDRPYYTGAPVVSGLVPQPYDVALDGRPFQLQLDKQAIEAWGVYPRRVSLPLLRDQADQSDEPGEQSVSPEQFWRRSQQSWHDGAGQSWLDWPKADRTRFRTSKGVNVWTQKQLSLLNSTSKVLTTTNTGFTMCVAGSRAYLGDGNNLKFTPDTTTWTTVTGTPASACTSVASDGYDIWAAFGANGIYSSNTGSGAASSYATGTVSLVGYVKGRLMAAGGAAIYNVTGSGALPAALFTHANAQFAWVGFADVPGFVMAAGYAGGHSEIYAITITSTASSLAAPVIAGVLPEGEIVRCIYGYLGMLLIGTDKGLRLATVDSSGALTLGGLINQPGAVYSLDAQDRFVWFGWTNFDTTSTGLGRADLSTFTSTLVPAFASDLMASSQGAVKATVQLGSKRMFTVEGVGVYAETLATPVTSGYLQSGFISYDIADTKQAVFLDLRHEPLPTGGSVTGSISYDAGSFASVGTSGTAGSTRTDPFYLNGTLAERFEIQLTLAAASGSSPTVTRYTLRADVTPQPSSEFVLPLVISDAVDTDDIDYYQSTAADVAALVGLHETQKIFALQLGPDTYLVKMTNFDWLPQHRSADTPGDYNGVFVATCRHISG